MRTRRETADMMSSQGLNSSGIGLHVMEVELEQWSLKKWKLSWASGWEHREFHLDLTNTKRKPKRWGFFISHVFFMFVYKFMIKLCARYYSTGLERQTRKQLNVSPKTVRNLCDCICTYSCVCFGRRSSGRGMSGWPGAVWWRAAGEEVSSGGRQTALSASGVHRGWSPAGSWGLCERCPCRNKHKCGFSRGITGISESMPFWTDVSFDMLYIIGIWYTVSS